jgi:hypothetical protein
MLCVYLANAEFFAGPDAGPAVQVIDNDPDAYFGDLKDGD